MNNGNNVNFFSTRNLYKLALIVLCCALFTIVPYLIPFGLVYIAPEPFIKHYTYLLIILVGFVYVIGSFFAKKPSLYISLLLSGFITIFIITSQESMSKIRDVLDIPIRSLPIIAEIIIFSIFAGIVCYLYYHFNYAQDYAQEVCDHTKDLSSSHHKAFIIARETLIALLIYFCLAFIAKSASVAFASHFLLPKEETRKEASATDQTEKTFKEQMQQQLSEMREMTEYMKVSLKIMNSKKYAVYQSIVLLLASVLFLIIAFTISPRFLALMYGFFLAAANSLSHMIDRLLSTIIPDQYMWIHVVIAIISMLLIFSSFIWIAYKRHKKLHEIR